jgi:hypothetical protein
MRTILRIVLLLGAAACPLACRPLKFDLIGRGKATIRDPGDLVATGIVTAINDSGMVAFPGLDVHGSTALFTGNGGSLTELGLGSTGLDNPDPKIALIDAVRIDAANELAFHGTSHDANNLATYGVFSIPLGASAPTALIVETPGIGHNDHPHGLGLSPNGTVATSTIADGAGAVLRGPIAGPLVSVRDGSGTFYNTIDVDVNDAGQVAVEMEHSDPTRGLARGILLFTGANQTLPQTTAGIEQLSVGQQPTVSINAAGDIAFALGSPVTLRFYDPPLSGDPSQLVEMRTLEPGVYRSHPTPFGTSLDLTLIANVADGFTSFGRVLIDDEGRVVFDAALADGRRGIFSGPRPQTDAIVVEQNFQSGPEPFQRVDLGGFNNAGQVVFHAVGYYTGLDEIWRVSGF